MLYLNQNIYYHKKTSQQNEVVVNYHNFIHKVIVEGRFLYKLMSEKQNG